MFRDNNEEFLRCFEAYNEPTDQFQLFNYGQILLVGRCSDEAKLRYNINLQERKNGEEGSINEPLKYQIVQREQKQEKTLKKVNFISANFSKPRKMSGDEFDTKKGKKIQLNIEECYKSQKSSARNQNQMHREIGDFSDKKSQGCKFEFYQIEGSFWKKLRNLETRLKNVSLNYNTLMMKIKQEDKQLEKENRLYKKFMQENCPELIQKLHEYIQRCNQQESNSSLLDSSSNSSKDDCNDQWMPIMSKIQQIKIDVTKIFQTVKNYQQSLNKIQQVNASVKINQIQLNKLKNPQQILRKTLQKKFSFPTGFSREKKQSFQTTTITQQHTIPLKRQNSSILQHCKQSKHIISQTNEFLPLVQTDQV